MIRRALTVQEALQNAVNQTIQEDLDFRLPQLSDAGWEPLLRPNDKERERMEFVGDALMSACVAQELYHCFPSESPHFYTILRGVLTTNQTFANFMAKMGIHDLKGPVKPAADGFEMVVAAYHKEQGFAALCSWIHEIYPPLMYAARDAWDDLFDRKRNCEFTKKGRKKGKGHISRGPPSCSVSFQRARAVSPSPTHETTGSPVVIDLTVDDEFDMDTDTGDPQISSSSLHSDLNAAMPPVGAFPTASRRPSSYYGLRSSSYLDSSESPTLPRLLERLRTPSNGETSINKSSSTSPMAGHSHSQASYVGSIANPIIIDD